jgi:ketosteroid isomerase-like protein
MNEIEHNKKLVVDCMKAMQESDLGLLRKVMAPDAEIWVPEGTRFSGTYTPEAYLKNLGAAVYPLVNPDGEHRMDLLSFTAEEDRVAMEAESYVELKNGRVYNNKYHLMFRIKDNLIVHMKEYLNTQHVVDVFGE